MHDLDKININECLVAKNLLTNVTKTNEPSNVATFVRALIHIHIGNILLESIHLTYGLLLIVIVCLLFCYRNWTCCSIISQTVCSCDQNH